MCPPFPHRWPWLVQHHHPRRLHSVPYDSKTSKMWLDLPRTVSKHTPWLWPGAGRERNFQSPNFGCVVTYLLPREVSESPPLFWEQGHFAQIYVVAIYREFLPFGIQSFQPGTFQCVHPRRSRCAASPCGSQSRGEGNSGGLWLGLSQSHGTLKLWRETERKGWFTNCWHLLKVYSPHQCPV